MALKGSMNDLRSAFAIKGLIAGSSGAEGTLPAPQSGKTRSPRSLRSLVLLLITTLIAVALWVAKLKQAMLGVLTILAIARTILRMLKSRDFGPKS